MIFVCFGIDFGEEWRILPYYKKIGLIRTPRISVDTSEWDYAPVEICRKE